jgi:hypothetical protein
MFESLDDKDASERFPAPGGWNDPSYRLLFIAGVVVIVAVKFVSDYVRSPYAQTFIQIALGFMAVVAGVWFLRRVARVKRHKPRS